MEIRLGLNSIRLLCDKMNNPQDKLRFIHIAGTNGKGSTGAFISSILIEAGYRVGVFSSPSVFSREESIRVGRRNISRRDYDEGLGYINALSDELYHEQGIQVTPFERETALSFWYFEKKACDIVVLECGMGGRSDATNIIENTLVAVFTSISIDHTDYLGRTLEEIAAVKAGIIKPGARSVAAPCEAVVKDILDKEAQLYGSEVNIIQPSKFKRGALGIRGINQNENASLAIEAIHCLPKEFKISEGAIERGLHNARLSGRFEALNHRPTVILDGGHNPAAAEVLKENILTFYPKSRVVLVVGMLSNKDHRGYLRRLLPICEGLLTVSTTGNRGYSCSELAKDAIAVARELGDSETKISALGGAKEAVQIASLMVEGSDIIVVCGTFSILSEIKEAMKEKR